MVDAPVVLAASVTMDVLDVCHFPLITPEFLGAYAIMIIFFVKDTGASSDLLSPIFELNLLLWLKKLCSQSALNLRGFSFGRCPRRAGRLSHPESF